MPRNGNKPLTSTAKAQAQARGSALIVTNATKMVGLGLGVYEATVRDGRYSVMLFCTVCVLGAQVVENIMLKAIDRFFGGDV